MEQLGSPSAVAVDSLGNLAAAFEQGEQAVGHRQAVGTFSDCQNLQLLYLKSILISLNVNAMSIKTKRDNVPMADNKTFCALKVKQEFRSNSQLKLKLR